MKDSTTDRELRVGAFYWVIPALDPDYAEGDEWVNSTQPARYAGEGQWHFLDVEGRSDWSVIWVGAEIRAQP